MSSLPYGRFDVPHRLRMGLAAIGPDAWIEIDGDYAGDLREKRRLLDAERPRVLAALPGSEPAQREVREALARHLVVHHPGLARLHGRHLELLPLGERLDLDDERVPPIEAAARLVQEDLCVMERSGAGWCLTAAAVCFPTRWDLPSKLGLPLTAIHDPVPGYRARLAASADRFFDALEPGRLFGRANWSLLDDPTLFQPTVVRGGVRNAAIDAAHAGEQVWLRVERQTLRRLPETGAILFTIRIHRATLGVLAADSAAAAALAASVRSMDAELARYKALAPVRDAALAWLDAVVAAASTARG